MERSGLNEERFLERWLCEVCSVVSMSINARDLSGVDVDRLVYRTKQSDQARLQTYDERVERQIYTAAKIQLFSKFSR